MGARLAELFGALSLFADLADGFPPEKVLRSTLLAVAIGRRSGLGDAVLRDTFYVNLLRYMGCIGFSHEQAHVYGVGNDIETRSVMSMADVTEVGATLARIVRGIGRGAPVGQRIVALSRLASDPSAARNHARAQCDTSLWVAQAIGMSEEVVQPLATICERWDGRGLPNGIAGNELPVSMRLHHVADVAEIAIRERGVEGAIALVERRAGKQLDPSFARCFVGHVHELAAMVQGPDLWTRYLDSEPTPHALADATQLDDLARAVSAIIDLKSVYTVGHSWSVCKAVEPAAEALGFSATERRDLRRAALLHDVGRAAIPNAIWDKPGPLTSTEWEQVRLHAYYTERILARSSALKEVAQIAACTHERNDGSGYLRGVADGASAAGRLLAAADVYVAMQELRAHRPAHSSEDARALILAESRAGRLCRRSVDALLGVANETTASRATASPCGLTEREIEVLVLVARGKSNREIAQLLGISARTVQNHVAHVYDKAGLYSRAGAALFAIENGLLGASKIDRSG